MCLALGDRKLVAAFVLRVACVAFDPDVGELVAGFLLQGLLPDCLLYTLTLPTIYSV